MYAYCYKVRPLSASNRLDGASDFSSRGGYYGQVVHRDWYVVRPIQGPTDIAKKPFHPDPSWECISGKRFWKNGEVCFPQDKVREGKLRDYRTVFGYNVGHNGNVLMRSSRNMRYGLRRLLSSRPSPPGWAPGLHHAWLESRQNSYILNHFKELTAFFSKWTLNGSVEDLFLEAEEHHGDPHAKRLLRIQAFKNLCESGILGKDGWLEKLPLLKMKVDEIAKSMKWIRFIGDLGTAASLLGFRVTKMMKYMMAAEPLYYKNGAIEFCPGPSPAELIPVFTKLITPPGRFYFVYFSDDSCFSYRDSSGAVSFYNLDISSCDTSHGPNLFTLLCSIFGKDMTKDLLRIVEQLRKPIRIVDPSNKKNKVIIRSDKPRLLSGSTITTVINNLANVLIARCIADANFDSPNFSIAAQAKRCGYVLTGGSACEKLTDLHQIQFLKHSPVYCNKGSLRALLNIGVMLRSSGQCKGDLPGRGSIAERGACFQRAYLRGMYPNASFPLLRAMRAICASPSTSVKNELAATAMVQKSLLYKVTAKVDKTWYVSDFEVGLRYGFLGNEMEAVTELMAHTGYEETTTSFELGVILGHDYGLKAHEFDVDDLIDCDHN